MSRLYRQDDRDGLTATLKARQERYLSHVNSRDPSLRTPLRLERLKHHVDEAQAALDAHIAEHGPNGDGVPHETGIFAHDETGAQTLIRFADGSPLTFDDLETYFRNGRPI